MSVNNSSLSFMNNNFFLLKSLVLFSPVIVVMVMFGAALMNNNFLMFLIYYLFISFCLFIRMGLFLLYDIIQQKNVHLSNLSVASTNIQQSTPCETWLVTPFMFSSIQRGTIPLFTFFFTMTYLLLPSWISKRMNANSISFFIFFIIYLVYDFTMRHKFVKCFTPLLSYYSMIKILTELILGVGLGALSLVILQNMGGSDMLYFQDGGFAKSKQRKVYKCGKLNTKR